MLLIACTASSCQKSCLGCPFRSGDEKTLDPTAVERVASLLGKIEEALVVVPEPAPPVTEKIVDILAQYARRVELLTPLENITALLNYSKIIRKSDELLLLVTQDSSLNLYVETIKLLLSQGFGRITLWVAIKEGGVKDRHRMALAIDFARKLGLKVVVGENPFSRSITVDPEKIVATLSNTEAGLFFGRLYGYRAMTVFVNSYPVVFLSKPFADDCRMLYIGPSGGVSKCPLLRDEVPIEELDTHTLRRLIYSKCKLRCRELELVPVINLSFKDAARGVEIPEDVLLLLEVVDQLNSLKAACDALGFAYSTYLEKLREIERRLGVKLMYTYRGGKSKGKALLTPFARRLLENYKNLKEILSQCLTDFLAYHCSESANSKHW